MPTEAMLKHLCGPFWFASRDRFLYPGIYFRSRRILPLPRPAPAMHLIEFREQTVVIAKDQPEYQPLPAHQFGDASGTIACCWKLNLHERLRLLVTGKIWHQILTFNQPLQPQLLTVDKPAMEFKPREPWPRK